MALHRRQRNRSSNANKPKSGENSKNSGGSGNSSGNKRNPQQQKRTEFKFQLHDPSRKGGYTYERLHEAIVIKIQKEFTSGRHIVQSLRNGAKAGPAIPTRDVSTLADAEQKRIQQETHNRKYDAELNYYFTANAEFENNWQKAYGLIFDSYCSKDMQLALKELPDFDSRVRDDPLELLREAERLTHVPKKALYPILALVETLAGLPALRQGEKEGLLNYLERFKSEKNVVRILFGDLILDTT